MATRCCLVAIALSVFVAAASPQPASNRDAPLPRAMWVWDADPLLESARLKPGTTSDRPDATSDRPDARTELLAFCKAENIGTIWLQVEDLRERPADWRSLIADAHRERVRLEALDGAPHYALKEYHDVPLGLVDAVIAFNDASKPEERFDGIHFDNEPYLLPGWSDPDERQQILKEYLALNTEAARRVHERSTMVIGVDVPSWWPATAFQIVDLLENVGIMDYRNTAEGSDGMIAHAMALLTYAQQPPSTSPGKKRAKIYVGVETGFSGPRTFWFAAGLPSREFRRIAGRDGRKLPATISGFQTKRVSSGGAIHVGLRVAEATLDDRRLREAMREVVRTYGAAGRAERASDAERVAGNAVGDLRRDPEWIDEQLRPIEGPDGQPPSPGFQATAIMLPKLTFAVKSIDEMRRELDRAERVFRRYSQYAGIAIHHYESYKRLHSSNEAKASSHE